MIITILRKIIPIILLISLIILNTLNWHNNVGITLIGLFYVLCFVLYSYNCISLFFIIICSVIFDSTNSVYIGVSAIVLTFFCAISNLLTYSKINQLTLFICSTFMVVMISLLLQFISIYGYFIEISNIMYFVISNVTLFIFVSIVIIAIKKQLHDK